MASTKSAAYEAFKSAAVRRFSDRSESAAIYEFSCLPEARALYDAYTSAEPDTTPEPRQAAESPRSTAYDRLRAAATRQFSDRSETDAIVAFTATPEGRELYAAHRRQVLYGEEPEPATPTVPARRASEPPQFFTGSIEQQSGSPAPPARLACERGSNGTYVCGTSSRELDRYATELLRVAHERPRLRSASEIHAETARRRSGVA